MTARRKRSKRRSAGNAARRRQPPVFFIDHCLGRHDVADMLHAAGYEVKRLTDQYGQDVDDPVWLEEAGREQWVVLTKDTKFRKNPLEIEAVLRASVRVFVLTGGSMRASEQADAFKRALPSIVKACHQKGPFIGRVTAGGAVRVNTSELRKWLA